jgi:hypothetical protein
MDSLKEEDIFESQDLSNEKMNIIYKQINNNICKIENEHKGNFIGLFCYIKFPDKFNILPVLITDSNIFRDNNNIIGNKIEFKLNKKLYEIIIDESRKVYINRKYNISIIEIKQSDGIDINSFLSIDEEIYNKKVYKIYFEKNGNIKCCFGKINKQDKNNYIIKYNNSNNSYYSDGPILNLENNELIGINK